jgi:exonuclease SbcD
MRILHTSDWHLGQHFFTQSRLEEHSRFIEWLCNTIEQRQIGAVIVAGDVYDTGSPPSYARELYNRFVVKMHQLNCQVVILAGNHDSVAVLEESQQLLAYLNTHVITTAQNDCTQQIVELNDERGELAAVVCAVPFLRPRDVIQQNEGKSAQQRQQVLSQAISNHYQQVFQSAVDVRDARNVNAPIIGTGHLTTLGVTQSDSVRDIYIGSLEGFSANQFPAFDYLALGHIHRPQLVSKKHNFRYSGSPIALSFDEASTQKSVVIVDCSNQCATELVDVPVFRELVSLSGTLQQIEQGINEVNERMSEGDLERWLSITVSSVEQYSDIQNKIQSLLEPVNASVLRIQRQASEKAQLSDVIEHSLDELQPADVFERKLQQELPEADDEREEYAQHNKRVTRIREHFTQILNQIETEQSDAQQANGEERA